MRLLTNPSSLDDGGEHSQARLGGLVGKVVFLLSRRAVFADEPGLVPRQMLLTLVPDPLRWSVNIVVVEHACKMGLEGIVSKRLGSTYRRGRTGDWLKYKNPEAPAVKRKAEEDWGR